jgi:EF hand
METKMNTLAKLSIASALMLSAACGVASAQQADDMPETQMEKGHGGKHHGKHHGKNGMRMIDANNDGVIGEDEAAAMADRAFMRMDDNRDEKLSEAEFTAGRHGKRGGWFSWNNDEKAAVEKVRKDKFASLDVNKDANLDKVEFFAEAKAKLAAADLDKDGKVSPWEFRASR